MVSKHDEVPDIAQIHNESEEQNHLDKSVIVYDNENRVFYSNSPDYGNGIIGIRYWQPQTVGWISAFNGFLKSWIDNIKLTKVLCENS